MEHSSIRVAPANKPNMGFVEYFWALNEIKKDVYSSHQDLGRSTSPVMSYLTNLLARQLLPAGRCIKIV